MLGGAEDGDVEKEVCARYRFRYAIPAEAIRGLEAWRLDKIRAREISDSRILMDTSSMDFRWIFDGFSMDVQQIFVGRTVDRFWIDFREKQYCTFLGFLPSYIRV